MIRNLTAVLAALGLSLSISPANADEPTPAPAPAPAAAANVCKDSYENAQDLMQPNQSTSKLMPAREMLRTCMRSGCKDWMVADCSKWLSEVEARIPTVVFSAKNTAGRDLTDINVTRAASGDVLAPRLDGHAVEMEPGEQVFVFIAPDGTKREKRALVREGEKSQSITAVFDAPPGELGDRDKVNPFGNGNGNNNNGERAPKTTSTFTYAGYGMAGVGTIGLAIGTIFGITAISKKNEANCDPSNACDAGPLSDARSAATVATVGLIAGGALLAGGVAVILLAPSSSSKTSARATIGSNGGGGPSLGFTGSW